MSGSFTSTNFLPLPRPYDTASTRLPADAALVNLISRTRANMVGADMPVTSVNIALPPYPIASASAAAHKLRSRRSRYGRRSCHLVRTSNLFAMLASGASVPSGPCASDRVSGSYCGAVDDVPVPRQKFIGARGRVIVDPAEHIGEPGLRVDIVHLGRDDQAVHGRGPLAATIGSGEQP